MKIEIGQKEFYKGINIVRKAVSSKTTLPVLSGILLKTVGDQLKLVGTDLEIGIECFVEAEIIEEGAIVLPAKYFTRIIKELPNEKVLLEVDSTNNSAFIKCASSKFNINGTAGDEFPQLPEINTDNNFKISQQKLEEMIKQVEFAISEDESKPFLTGGQLLIEDGVIKLVATDTYRLAYREDQLENKELNIQDIIIPANSLNEVRKLLDGSEEMVEVSVTESQILFKFAGISIISRLIEGQFPDYNQVIPNANQSQIKVNRKNLLQATKRAALLAREDANIIKLNFNQDKLIITANAPELGQVYEEVAIELEGEETEIAFNANYIIDALKVITSEGVTLELSGSLAPGVIKSNFEEEYTYVIMPVRSA